MIDATYLEAFALRLSGSSTADVGALLAVLAAELLARDTDAALYAMRAYTALCERPAARFSEHGE